MRAKLTVGTLLLAALGVGCGGGGSQTPEVAGAQAETNNLQRQLELLGPDVRALEALACTIFDPDAAAAAGTSFLSISGAGIPDSTFRATIPFDRDNDGTPDTTLTGQVTFDRPLGSAPETGQTASITVDAPLIGVDGNISGTGRIEWLADGISISGDISVINRTTGRTTDVSVDASQPLLIKNATGEPDSQANVCDFSVQGSVSVSVNSLLGTLSSVWSLSFQSTSIRVLDVIFSLSGGDPREMPDESVALGDCGITVDSWVGIWRLNWNCIPVESGTSDQTFERINDRQLRVRAVENGVEIFSYTATLDPNNARIATGVFRETDSSGFTYAETFRYTMAPDGRSWSQDNDYEYEDGPSAGTGGRCFGTARPVQD